MNPKPLLPRFALLLGLLALAALTLVTKPIKKGMDLEGGHSLIFRVDTSGSSDSLGVLNSVIDTLRERVDPQGVMNLEWRPVGSDRIEVRMPIGSTRSREKQLAFLSELETLTERNIDPAFIRRLVNAPDAERAKMISQRVGTGPRAEMLKQAAELHDAADTASKEIASSLKELQGQMAKLRSADKLDSEAIDSLQGEIDKLTGPRDVARGEYYALVRQIYDTNIRTSDLMGILKLYDSPRVAAQMAQKKVEKRKADLKAALEAYAQKYPDIADNIAEVASLYKKWANERGPLDDPDDLIRLIRKAGVLEFRIAATVAQATELSEYIGHLQDLSRGPSYSRDRNMDYQWFQVRDGEEIGSGHPEAPIVMSFGGRDYVLLSNLPDEAMLQTQDGPSWQLTRAMPGSDPSGRRAIDFQLDVTGAKIFGELTGTHIGQPMAILLDDEVYSAPRINSAITARGQITGDFTGTEQGELVKTLNSGSVRARVNPDPVAMNSIGPTLGQENIRRGLQAAVYGMICVVIFMTLYYWIAGLIANFALAINVVFIMASLAAFDVVFTLPGIAGLILTMGIAVDANVLIFERLREERRTESDMMRALSNAYDRAFTAIFDGNITTLLVCIILWWVGTQEIKGFAMTLGIGIVISLFTALLVTRWVFRAIKPADWNLKMMGLVGLPKIDWFSKRKAFWALSGILIVAGLFGIVTRGGNLMGIEFSSGSRAVVHLTDEALVEDGVINDAKVADMLRSAGDKLDQPLMAGQNVQVNELKTLTKAEDFVSRYDNKINGGNADSMVSREEWLAQDRSAEAFDAYVKLLDSDSDGKLSTAELQNMPEPRYQITTGQSDHNIVRQVIDAAFEGKLNALSSVDFNLMADKKVDSLGLTLNSDGYAVIPEELTGGDGIGGDFRQSFEMNVGGVLTAFTLSKPGDAMTPAELQARLKSTRLQAGREQNFVVNNTVLPLTPSKAKPHRFTSFAIISQSSDVPPRSQDADVWESFAAGEVDLLKDALGSKRSLESLTNFDSAMTVKATRLAIVAVLLSWVGIIVYLWVRFGSVQWGLAAVICLVHDTLIVVGLVALCGLVASTGLGKLLMIDAFKIDMTVIAAVLTVIGYSVNDTIVVFDRIRENRKKAAKVTPHVLNRSINQTLARTLLTSTTTLLVVVTMYIFGGDGIHGFSFTLLAGIIFGTYSSIAIASPLLLGFKQALVAQVTNADSDQDEQ